MIGFVVSDGMLLVDDTSKRLKSGVEQHEAAVRDGRGRKKLAQGEVWERVGLGKGLPDQRKPFLLKKVLSIQHQPGTNISPRAKTIPLVISTTMV